MAAARISFHGIWEISWASQIFQRKIEKWEVNWKIFGLDVDGDIAFLTFSGLVWGFFNTLLRRGTLCWNTPGDTVSILPAQHIKISPSGLDMNNTTSRGGGTIQSDISLKNEENEKDSYFSWKSVVKPKLFSPLMYSWSGTSILTSSALLALNSKYCSILYCVETQKQWDWKAPQKISSEAMCSQPLPVTWKGWSIKVLHDVIFWYSFMKTYTAGQF